MLNEIFSALKSEGVLAYTIGQHRGTCSEPFVVVIENGTEKYSGVQLSFDVIDIKIFYPVGKYMELSVFVDYVRRALTNLKELRLAEILPTILDTDLLAYSLTLRYQLFKRRG